MQIRLFCREVLLDPWSNQLDGQFWLTMFLRPWPLVSQARLLFILYGPLQPEGEITFTLRLNTGECFFFFKVRPMVKVVFCLHCFSHKIPKTMFCIYHLCSLLCGAALELIIILPQSYEVRHKIKNRFHLKNIHIFSQGWCLFLY